jgi:hypothetical protein
LRQGKEHGVDNEKTGKGEDGKTSVGEREKGRTEADQIAQLLELNKYLVAERAELERKLKVAEEFVSAVRGVKEFNDVAMLIADEGVPQFFDIVYSHVMEEFYKALKCTKQYDAYESDGGLEEAISYEVTSLLQAAGVLDENHELRSASLVKAFEDVATFLVDDQGFIYDQHEAECTTCNGKAKTIAEIQHDEGCFTAAWQKLSGLINTLRPPESAPSVKSADTAS